MENRFVALTALSTVQCMPVGLHSNHFFKKYAKQFTEIFFINPISLGDLCELGRSWQILGIFGSSLESVGYLGSLGSLWRSLEIIER